MALRRPSIRRSLHTVQRQSRRGAAAEAVRVRPPWSPRRRAPLAPDRRRLAHGDVRDPCARSTATRSNPTGPAPATRTRSSGRRRRHARRAGRWPSVRRARRPLSAGSREFGSTRLAAASCIGRRRRGTPEVGRRPVLAHEGRPRRHGGSAASRRGIAHHTITRRPAGAARCPDDGTRPFVAEDRAPVWRSAP